MTEPAAPPAAAERVTCAFCRREFADEEPQLVVMREGVVAGVYHESCRPDRRRKGCSGC